MQNPVNGRPICGFCGGQMTSQNSQIHPELFLCDQCVIKGGLGPCTTQCQAVTESEALQRCIEALRYVKRWWDETGRDQGWHSSIGIHVDRALLIAETVNAKDNPE